MGFKGIVQDLFRILSFIKGIAGNVQDCASCFELRDYSWFYIYSLIHLVDLCWGGYVVSRMSDFCSIYIIYFLIRRVVHDFTFIFGLKGLIMILPCLLIELLISVLRIRIRKILASWIRIRKNMRRHGSGSKGQNINQKLH